MSQRLKKYGRYPKTPNVEPAVNNINSQFPQPNPPAPSQGSFYDPTLQQNQPMYYQTGHQNAWMQPAYSAPNTFQPNHGPQQTEYSNPNSYQPNPPSLQPAPHPESYWSGGQMHAPQAQTQWNQAWNYAPENIADTQSFTNYQQEAAPVQDQWQQPQYSHIDNQNYPQQSIPGYDESNPQEYQYSADYQPVSNNNPSAQLPTWENGSHGATQPDHGQWTYESQQYSEHPATDFSQSTTNTTSWPPNPNYVASSVNADNNLSDVPQASYLNPDNTIDPGNTSESQRSSPNIDQGGLKDLDADPSVDLKSENSTLVSDVASVELPIVGDYQPSTLSAFFHDGDQSEVGNDAEHDPSPALVQEASSQEDNASVAVDKRGSPLNVASGSDVGTRVVPEDDSSFVQKEDVIDLEEDKLESNTESLTGFIEEPINQEVPEPPQNDSANVISQPIEVYEENLAEEPQNQQVPALSEHISRSTSAERERLVIRPREESPFKPPKPSNSKVSGVVVQQEVAVQSLAETKHTEGKTVVQEVNLETFPDNLERPSDYEELRKQSPLYAAHRQHLRSELNSSPSSLLCDNLDIPCGVTLAPAAPPLSSAKSDKSESSTSSRAESLSVGKSNLSSLAMNESNSSSLASESLDVEAIEKSSSRKSPVKPSKVTQPSSASDFSNSSASESKKHHSRPEKLGKRDKSLPEISPDPQRPVHLRDSKVNGSGSTTNREPDPFKQHSSNSDISVSSVPQRRGSYKENDLHPQESRDPRYPERSDPRYPEQTDPRYPERTDPRYPERMDPKYPERADPRYPERADPRYPERTDPRYTERTDLRYPERTDPRYPERTDPRYPERTDPRYPERTDPRYPERTDPRYPERTDYRNRYPNQKYASFDDQQYYAELERSRPSSRSSLRGERQPEDYPYHRKEDYPTNRGDPLRYPQDFPPRPSSRSSETDVGRDRQGYGVQPYQYPPSNYPKGHEYYQRQQQPPYQRGYEYDDPYRSYYEACRYAYSSYNYGYYDEIYRNDPRYQQYREQYRQYYAKYGYDVDFDRSSRHSGRSSANEFSKEENSSGNYPEQDIDSINSEFSAYNPNQAYDNEQSEASNIEAILDHASTPSSRLTPMKFSYAHPIARFSPGGLLITAIPNQASSVPAMPIRIQSIQAIREDEESFQELKNYQGPLVRGSTHKNDVVEFCSQKIKAAKLSEEIVDRESYILLWELMVLLLRQNGSVAGSDIAELLLKDHEVLRPPSLLKNNIETPVEHSPDVIDSSSQSHAGDTSSPDEGIVVLHDKTLLNVPQTVDVDKITRKFREFLLFGHKKDALEWAMKHGIWGHALFLASKMDTRTYANVMTRFANSLALNDPLQTLYQLMSGRQPIAVTNVADKRWGDWRPHLAMILSNPSTHHDVDSRSITTLGDTLASRGCLCAAHFCYIMAQVEFGTFEQKNGKLVLLTVDHMLPFEEFATNEAIQVTEIYEYAQSLANSSFMLVHLQLYKFIYALRLIEHGFYEEALHYCEIIASKIQDHPHLFQLDFVSEIYKYSTLLKYHDPHFLRGQGEYEDQDDPDWLKNLALLVQNFNNYNTGEQQPQAYYEPQQDVNQQQNANFPQQYSLQQPTENVSCQNVPNASSPIETNNNPYMNAYQASHQQNSMTNSIFSPTSSPPDNVGYYQSDMGSSQGSFMRQNSIPSHEENETTDMPSSPVNQTPAFDYFSGGAQQDRSPLPSASPSDAAVRLPRSDVPSDATMTESDAGLCSSSHSTPLHNYLLSNDDSEDRRVLVPRAGVRTLNSCLKSSRHRKNRSIKFDASVAARPTTGVRRRRLSRKKPDCPEAASDSSPEGSPSKAKHKLSLLQSLGILKKKHHKSKKKETLEKLMQSKRTFAIDEPCEEWREKSADSTIETKKMAAVLKKLTDEEKKNSQLSRLMASEFHKKPPLIFGGTYPIDEPCGSVNPRGSRVDREVVADPIGRRSKHSAQLSQKSALSKTSEVALKQGLARMSPIAMLKKMHQSGKNVLHSKEGISNTSVSTTASSSSNPYKCERESIVHESKPPMFDSSNTYNNSTTGRERRDSALSSGSRYSTGSVSMANKTSTKETPKQETKKDKQTTQAGKTWLGGIFSRLLPKAPNQMILPDDKNPTIFWDETKNCWVNKDSNDEDESSAPAAPPTDMELMGSSKSSTNILQASGPPSNNLMPPSSSSVPPTSGMPPANKFQRPKTKGMRQNYVDVLNASGSTKKANVIPEGLFPSPYESLSPQPMFTPTQTPTTGENSAEMDNNYNNNFSSTQYDGRDPVETQSTPLMFNPSEFDARRTSVNNQRPTLSRTGRRTYPT